jgi:ABC-type dipeptide/oligopeptide/nickel transport system permease subunit
LVRASVLSVKQEEFVLAARTIGAPSRRIVVRHIVPNVLVPVIVTASFDIGTKILATSSLSFVGLGTQPPDPDWGNMLAEGRRFLTSGPHLSVIPGLAIFLVVVAGNLLGDGLRDALDPTMKDV